MLDGPCAKWGASTEKRVGVGGNKQNQARAEEKQGRDQRGPSTQDQRGFVNRQPIAKGVAGQSFAQQFEQLVDSNDGQHQGS